MTATIRCLVLATSVAWCIATLPLAAQDQNPVTNGGFEQLGPNGFPVDWSTVGRIVTVSTDAHSGGCSLDINRVDESLPETGANRDWQPDSGKQGTMLDRLKGGIAFWYKAISSQDADLTMYVIPMSARPYEDTGEARARFDLPKKHVGDGQWHEGKLKYDFTADPKAKWVHISPRITGGTGEFLLDDVRWVEHVGPQLVLGDVEVAEDPTQPGRRCTVSCELTNAGDMPATAIRASVVLPKDLRPVGPASRSLADLQQDVKTKLSWTVLGERDRSATIEIQATAKGTTVAPAILKIAPMVEVSSFGAESFVLAEGEETSLRCVVVDSGHATVRGIRASVTLPEQLQLVTGSASASVVALAPGGKQVITWRVRATSQSPRAEVKVAVSAANAGAVSRSNVVVAGGALPPAPAVGTSARSYLLGAKAAGLDNGRLRMVFPKATYGYGISSIQANVDGAYSLIGKLSRLSRLAYLDGGGATRDVPLYASSAELEQSSDGSFAGLILSGVHRGDDGTNWSFKSAFRASAGSPEIWFEYRLSADKASRLLCFEGPMIYVGEGSFGAAKTEASVGGMEWLVDGEKSSSKRDDISPNWNRYVAHPNEFTIPYMGVQQGSLCVGLLWDVHQLWDGENDRMSAVFASPDWFEDHNSHLMGVFVPSVPKWVKENERTADPETPYELPAGRELLIRGRIVASTSARDAIEPMRRWFEVGGVPEPLPFPHADSWVGEVKWSMQAYMDPEILWVPDEEQWWGSKGAGPLLSTKGRSPFFAQDLWFASQLMPTDPEAQAWRERAKLVLAKLPPTAAGLDFSFHVGYPDEVLRRHRLGIADLLQSQGPDGSWRFDADRKDYGIFKGMDYHELGYTGQEANGLVARSAYELLRFSHMTGDPTSLQAGVRALRYMRKFRVPRAAQVWEVPVHAPDILAAADAVEAYLEGYWITGDTQWLNDAITWAWRGLPFVYMWNTDEYKFMRGASIPIMGASWNKYSWIGRPVQWNGLRLAYAYQKLAPLDRSLDWARLADLLTVSAMYQQGTEGGEKCLWPDSISAVDGGRASWVFAPAQIDQCVYKRMGRDMQPTTVIVGEADPRIRLNTGAQVTKASLDPGDKVLRATLKYPPGDTSYVVLAAIEKPWGVRVNGRKLPESATLEQDDGPGYRYADDIGLLTVKIIHADTDHLEVLGAKAKAFPMIPTLARRIDFEFNRAGDLEDWWGFNDLANMDVHGGVLRMTATGGDPFFSRAFMQANGSQVSTIIVRMSMAAGEFGQFYWGTKDSPGFDEQKVLRIPITADGRMHEYRIAVGAHSLWKGHTITAIRLDPTNGAPGARIEVDYIRGQ